MSKIKDSFFGGAEKKAGKVQARAAEASVEEQRRQFDISQQQLAPFRQAGLGALQQQLALLGLPGLDPSQFAGAPAAGQLGPSGQQLFVQTRAKRSPFGPPSKFVPFEQQQQEVPGLPPAVSREDALAAFAETPGQQFLRERQERSLLRSAGAIGGLGGGNIRTALQEQAFGRGATQLGEFQNRLAALSGSGQVATQNIAQLGAQAAGQIGQGLQAAGAARASGIVGQAAGFRGGVGQVAQIAGAFSDIHLKKNIVKIDELPSGLNWYMWDWREGALDMVGDQPCEGVIAQEAAEIFPDSVFKENGYLKVNYAEIH